MVCFVFLFGVGITKVMFLWPEFKRLRTTRITQTLQLQSSLSSEICYITLLREEASSQFMIPTKYVIWQIFPVIVVISRFISRLKSLQQDENKLICSTYTFLKYIQMHWMYHKSSEASFTFMWTQQLWPVGPTLKQMGFSSRRPQLQFTQAQQNWTIEGWVRIWSKITKTLHVAKLKPSNWFLE